MNKKPLLIINAHLVDANIDIKNSALMICDGKIVGMPTKNALKQALKNPDISVFDAQGYVVMPSFIDMHAHFRDPGFTQKEDLASGSKAAAAGGFGTVILMPNTNPVISSLELAEQNNKKVSELGFVQAFQAVSITKDFNGSDISHLSSLNKKIVPLITEDGHEVEDSNVMFEAMKLAAKKDLIVSCHCEDPFLAKAAKPLRSEALKLLAQNNNNPTAEQKKKASKLLEQANILLELAEDSATLRNILLAQKAGCHIHLCHVSTKKSLEAVKKAKENGVNITCEVTPHHLSLCGTKGANLLQIVNPPLRSEEDRSFVVKALKDGIADVIATDHAPHTLEDKVAGSPGFSGLETAFATCYTTLVLQNGMKLKELSSLMSEKPAKILGFTNQGLLQQNYDANITIVDTDSIITVRGDEFASKGKYTPLEGKKLTGDIVATFYKGQIVFQR